MSGSPGFVLEVERGLAWRDTWRRAAPCAEVSQNAENPAGRKGESLHTPSGHPFPKWLLAEDKPRADGASPHPLGGKKRAVMYNQKRYKSRELFLTPHTLSWRSCNSSWGGVVNNR